MDTESLHPVSEPTGTLRPLDEDERGAILEYLTELVPIEGVIYEDETEATIHRGRTAVRRLANGSAKLLPLADCADVLEMLSHCEPRTKPFPIDSNHYVGQISLLAVLAQSVRESGGRVQP